MRKKPKKPKKGKKRMSLIDRIFHDDPDSTRNITNHAFSAALWFWAKGDITRSQVIAAFNMTTDDEVQLDQLQAHYESLSTQNKKSFHSDVEAAGILAESGLITKAVYRSLLGLP